MNEWTPANSHEEAARRIKTTCAAFERALNVDAYIAEIEQLKAINAELLAVLIQVRDGGCRLRLVDEIEQEYVSVPHPETVAAVEAAIKKVKQ